MCESFEFDDLHYNFFLNNENFKNTIEMPKNTGMGWGDYDMFMLHGIMQLINTF